MNGHQGEDRPRQRYTFNRTITMGNVLSLIAYLVLFVGFLFRTEGHIKDGTIHQTTETINKTFIRDDLYQKDVDHWAEKFTEINKKLDKLLDEEK